MTLRSSTNVHGVRDMTMQTKQFAGFVSTQFRFLLDDGTEVEFSAFSPRPLDLTTLPTRVIEQPAQVAA